MAVLTLYMQLENYEVEVNEFEEVHECNVHHRVQGLVHEVIIPKSPMSMTHDLVSVCVESKRQRLFIVCTWLQQQSCHKLQD